MTAAMVFGVQHTEGVTLGVGKQGGDVHRYVRVDNDLARLGQLHFEEKYRLAFRGLSEDRTVSVALFDAETRITV